MENLILTQLSAAELKKLFREEIEDFFRTFTFTKEQDVTGGIDLAVEITGLSKPTVYNLVSKRKIPFSKRGKRLYFSREDLLDWIKKGKRRTIDEITSERQ